MVGVRNQKVKDEKDAAAKRKTAQGAHGTAMRIPTGGLSIDWLID